ncbi:MAG: efflux RND transporter permease subunit, partial [Panacagrimonas sp.]
MNAFQKLIELAARRPTIMLFLVLGLSIYSFLRLIELPSFVSRLKIDPSTETLLPQDDADRQVFERVRDTFGDADAVLMSVRLEPMFTPDNMARIDQLTQELRKFPGVKNVFSLGTAPNVLAQGEDLEVSTFTRQAAQDPEAVKRFPEQIAANPIYRGLLVAEDGVHTALAIGLDAQGETLFRRENYTRKFREAAERITGSKEVWLAGSPVVKAASTGAMLDTLTFSVPMIYGVAVLMLLVAFRSFRAMFAAILTVTVALLWTGATAVVLGYSLNLVSIITPPLIITLGLAYAIHLLSDYYAEAATNAEERRARALNVMGRVGVGLLLAGATTIAGFLALMPNALPAIREFAVLSSIGVIYLFVLILLFLPALLDVMRCGRHARGHGTQAMERLADRLALFDIRWRQPIIWIALILVPINLWLASGIPVGTDYIKSFRDGHPVREQYEAINRIFNGANIVSVVIETHVNDALTDPELVRGIDDLQSWLRDQPE